MKNNLLQIFIISYTSFSVIGCTSINTDRSFLEVQELVSQRITQKVEWNKNSEDDKKVEEAVSKMLEAELSFDQAVQIALLNNPELQVVFENLGIAQAELVQSGLLKNTVFDAEIHFQGGGIGAGTNLNLVQDFINLLQLPLRKKIAADIFDGVKLEVTQTVLNLTSEVKMAYFSLQAAQKIYNLRKTVLEGLDAAAEISRRQHQAGNITDLQYALDRSLSAQANLELTQAKTEVLDWREKLNLLMGLWGENSSKWEISSKLPALPNPEITLSELENLAVTNRFDLAQAKKYIESEAKKLDLTETYKYIPEFSLGVDLEGESGGKVIVGPNFSLPLPIFDQGDARVASAEGLLRQAQKKYLVLAIKIRQEVRSSRNQMVAARSRAEYAKKVLIPINHEILQQTQLEYNGMLVGVFNLLSAKKDEIEGGKIYIDSLRDYWLARTELEKAVGGNLEQNSDKKEN